MNNAETLPVLVVEFDGFLNAMPHGWFDMGSHENKAASDAVKFLIAATEYFEVNVFGPRSLQFAGIATMQAAIILWTRMQVNNDTMHDLMNALIFPMEMPEEYAVAVSGTGVKWGTTKDALDPEAIDFVNVWQEALSNESLAPNVRRAQHRASDNAAPQGIGVQELPDTDAKEEE